MGLQPPGGEHDGRQKTEARPTHPGPERRVNEIEYFVEDEGGGADRRDKQKPSQKILCEAFHGHPSN